MYVQCFCMLLMCFECDVCFAWLQCTCNTRDDIVLYNVVYSIVSFDLYDVIIGLIAAIKQSQKYIKEYGFV